MREYSIKYLFRERVSIKFPSMTELESLRNVLKSRIIPVTGYLVTCWWRSTIKNITKCTSRVSVPIYTRSSNK